MQYSAWVTFLLAAVLPPPASGGSVWWEWWSNASECERNSKGQGSLNREWTLDQECIVSGNLKKEDPLRRLTEELYPETINSSTLDVSIHCCDPANPDCEGSSEGGNVNAVDDIAVVRVFNSTDGSCSGLLLFEIKQNTTMCGFDADQNISVQPLARDPSRSTLTLPLPEAGDLSSNVTRTHVNVIQAFDASRVHCSRCRWTFMEAAAPPYSLQAVQILLFLIGCIIFNFTLEDLFNKVMKKAPPKLLPCLFPPEEPLAPNELRPGVTVLVPSAEWYLAAAARRQLAAKRGPGSPRMLPEERRPAALPQTTAETQLQWEQQQQPQARAIPSLSDDSDDSCVSVVASPQQAGQWEPASASPVSQPQQPTCVLQLPPALRRPKASGGAALDDDPSGSATLYAAPASDSPRREAASEDFLHVTPASVPAGRGAVSRYTSPPPPGSSGGRRVPPRSSLPPQRRTSRPATLLSSPEANAARDIVSLLSSAGSDAPASPPTHPYAVGGREQRPYRTPAGRGGGDWAAYHAAAETQHASANSLYGSQDGVPAYYEHGAPVPPDPLGATAVPQPPGALIGREALERAARIYREALQSSTVSSSREGQWEWSADDAVREYAEHGAVADLHSPLMGPTSPMSRSPPGSVRGPGPADDDFADDHEMCVVCGRDDAEKGAREGGFYRCQRPRDCINGTPRDILLEKASGMQEDSVAVFALAGALGQYGDVMGIMIKRGVRQCLVAFRRPRAWVKARRVERLENWEKRPAQGDDPGPTLRVEDKELEALWMRMLKPEKAKKPPPNAAPVGLRTLTKTSEQGRQSTKAKHKTALRFVVTHEAEDGERWKACELLGAIYVWLPATSVIKIADWGGPFCRTGEKEDLQEAMKESWKKWYGDFELCVGQVMRIQRAKPAEELAEGELGTFETVVAFKGSATIVFPIHSLHRCTEAQHDAEYLITPQPVVRRAMMGVFVASTAPALAAKGLLNLVTFTHAISAASSAGHGGRAGDHSIMGVYEEVYFKLFNSGYPTLVADCGSVTFYYMYAFTPTVEQFVAGVGKPIIFILIVSLVLCLPGLLTHAFPMVVYYIWLWLPLWLFVYCVYGGVQRFKPSEPTVDPDHQYDMLYWIKHHKGYLSKVGLYYVFIRVMAQLLVVVFMQTNYNYAVMAYRGRPYFTTIKSEFTSRQITCVLEQLSNVLTLIFGAG
eukprot:TRINITY_DN12892_c0_g2_i1.p1 TRINITY_DN12892_c0_g2~~TRINITY_DN12892_c0_g2_i1.p1  ORF type:complete len:1191 (+),score=267.99 TRINITY_DN12892_c0_g2_i1:71-3643(+)